MYQSPFERELELFFQEGFDSEPVLAPSSSNSTRIGGADEEAVTKDLPHHPPLVSSAVAAPVGDGGGVSGPLDLRHNVPIDSDENQAMLKKALNTTQMGSQASVRGSGYSLAKEQDKTVVGPIGIPALPTTQKVSGSQIRPTTSASSREQSDDEDGEGETEITDNIDPADVKRVRRCAGQF